MRFIKIISVMVAILLLAISLSACSESYKEAFVYVELDAKPTTLDPQLASSPEELTAVRSLFDTLLRFDSNGKIVPSAAESFEKKGNTFTFKLREDATWHEGDRVTAADFVFAFRRAVDPKTSAPYANMLFSVENAEDIYKGKAPLSSLGVSAVDDLTLIIKLTRDDTEFEKVLTSAITMPCNEEFFEGCMGKYGLTVDTTPSNGSYYVRKWTTEGKFLIRLAKNLEYNGKFEANSMRIYFTCSEKSVLDMLNQDNTDLAYIRTEEFDKISEAGFETVSFENTLYGLFLSPNLDPDIRKALLTSIDNGNFTGVLGDTQRVADGLYPAVLGASYPKVKSYIKYDPDVAYSIYSQKIKEGFALGSIAIKYQSDVASENLAKALAGHWQQTLSCFINIEKLSSSEISAAYSYGGYDIIIAPVTSAANTVTAYNSALGFSSDDGLSVSAELFGNYLCYPLFFSSAHVSAGKSVENLESSIQNGILDVSMLIKEP